MARMILAASLLVWGWHSPAAAALGCDAIPVTQRSVSIPSAPAAASVKVPASALFTFASADMREARSADSRSTWLLGAHQQQLVPLAGIEKAARQGAHQVRWYRPAQRSAAAARLSLDSMEHLYALLLKQDPQHHFRFPAESKAKAGSTWLSHSQALVRVASMRSCLATELQATEPGMAIKAWEVATIEPQPSRNAHGLEVVARVRGARGQPTAGHLSFSRGEHLACGAAVQKNGSGECTLFDEHGHELHDHEHQGPTVVMFSGIVGTDHIVLPTTQVYGKGVRR